MPKITIKLLGVKEIEASFNAFTIRFTDKRKMMEGALKAFYKIEKKRLGYANMPIMQMTGTLKDALTGKNQHDTYVEGTSEAFNLYIISNYWHNHQYGTTIPKRMTVNFTEADEALILKEMLDATIGGRLSRLFT